VAVVATTAAEADAWSTALNVLGENEGYALAKQHGMAALFIIDRNGVLESRTTPAMRKYVETSESR
jgi:thiamine biosynthesis lipoprotein